MKNVMQLFFLLLFLNTSLAACKKESDSPGKPSAEAGFVTGKVTDSRGNALAGIKIVIEHTVWYDSYVYAITDDKGFYKAQIPTEPAGSWTAKAQIERSAYGENYAFDLDPDNIDPFNGKGSTVRNFIWKLSGERPTSGFYYGAHVDLYQFGTRVQMDKVKLIFTPAQNTLIDGSTATTIERNVEDVAGTFMVKDIPIGKYSVKAVYPGKTLLLDNRHDDGEPAINKTVVFGKNGNLGETEYNVEFWLSE